MNLSSNNFGNAIDGRANYQPIRRLGKVLDLNSSITSLDLSANGCGPVGVGILAKAMTKNVSVRTLDLGGNNITGEAPEEQEDPELEEEDPVFGELQQGLESLSEVLKKNKFLKCLSLRDNRIKGEIDEQGEDEGLETSLGKFLEPFKKYHRLEVLDLAGNELGPGGAKMLANALVLNQSIRVLDLSDNQLGPRGLHHIGTLVKASKQLHTIVLHKNDIAGKRKGKKSIREALESLTYFAECIASHPSLRDLGLGGNHLGVEFSAALLSTLKATTIQTLHFDMNDLCGQRVGEYDGKALQCIIDALLRPDATLRNLHLAGNFIQPQGVAAMVADPLALKSVVLLDLSRNGLGNEGCATVCRFLGDIANPPALEQLILSYNFISDPSPLTAALRTVPKLIALDLANNNVGANLDSFQALIDVVTERPQLHSLDLSSNLLGAEHVKALVYLCKTSTPPFEALSRSTTTPASP